MRKLTQRLRPKANWDFEIIPMFMGYNNHGYYGAFPSEVENIIKGLIREPCIHLFSGTSKIGNVRIDLERPEATNNIDIFEFIKTPEAQKQWKWCLLDPPYEIVNAENELKEYGDKGSVSASIPKRNALAKFFLDYCENVLWLDQCAPLPFGFIRKKIYLFFPGGYRTLRV
jgi:hypothetical protein